MAYRQLFTPEEWKTLQYAILWVFHAIAEVDGVIDEAEGKALFEAMKGGIYYTNELMKELMAEVNNDPQALIAEFEKNPRGISMGLKDSAELVEKKLSPEAALDFKRTLLFMGATFARASGETSGETANPRISRTEQAAILTVAAILRLSPEEMMI